MPSAAALVLLQHARMGSWCVMQGCWHMHDPVPRMGFTRLWLGMCGASSSVVHVVQDCHLRVSVRAAVSQCHDDPSTLTRS